MFKFSDQGDINLEKQLTTKYVPCFKNKIKNIQYAENKEYDVSIFLPHIFTLAINEAYPGFATKYAVNLGAGDGKSCNDPVFPLYELGYAGLTVEAANNQDIFLNIPSEQVKKILGSYITPSNVAQLLEDNFCPQSPDFFKLDIDGYDGPVLLEVLKAGYRPKILQIEVNPEIPPPIEFAVLYNPKYIPVDSNGVVGGFYGASLSYICNVAKRFGYLPIQIDFIRQFTHDVTLVHEQYFHIASQIIGTLSAATSTRDMFLSHPSGYSHFSEYGINTQGWRYRTDFHELLIEIWSACLVANITKHPNYPIPFHLSVA